MPPIADLNTLLQHRAPTLNVGAGTHHDHLFVPVDHSAAAMDALRELQGRDRSASPHAGHIA